MQPPPILLFLKNVFIKFILFFERTQLVKSRPYTRRRADENADKKERVFEKE